MDKKEIIKQTAEHLFATKGYHATSIRDIAKGAKVNVAMITYYFKSKENLLLAIIQKLNEAAEIISNEMAGAESDAKKFQLFVCKSQEEFQKLTSACKIIIQLHMLDISLKVNTAIKKVKEKHYSTFLLAIGHTGAPEKWPHKNSYLYHSLLGLILEDVTYTLDDADHSEIPDTLHISDFLCSYLMAIIQYKFKTNASYTI